RCPAITGSSMVRPAPASCRRSSNSSKSRPPCSCEGLVTGDLEVLVETGSVAAIEIAASSLGKGHKQTGNCANCGHPLAGAYCASCGQPTNVHRRSIAGLVHELVVDVVNFDSRILRT